jgi:peptidoglycan/LPS O-acetylase OafA/YrhL
VAIASAGLIGTSLRSCSLPSRLFSLKPLRSLGRYSYGFYIFHVLYGWAWIQFLVFISAKTSMALGGIIALTVNFAATFLISKLSYELFEVRFLRYKTQFEYDSEVADHKHAFQSN